jgi:hypothetical protein
MFRRLQPTLILAATLGLFAGCADAPVQAMSDARQAIQAAEAAGAETAAPTEMAAAHDGLKHAEDLLKAREYRAAKRAAVTAHDAAAQALAATTKPH